MRPKPSPQSLANLEKGKIKKGQLSPEEARRRGSMGAKKSTESKRQKKTMQELAQIMLRHRAPESLKRKIKEFMPEMPAEDIDLCAAMLHMQIGNALKGDLKALEFLRDTSGEKPVDRIATTDSEGNDVTTIVFEGVEPTTPQNVGNGG